MNPVLSLVIPTYRRAEALKHSLPTTLCVIQKHGGRVELILSDNASPDDSFGIASGLCNGVTNVVLHRQKTNLGFEGNSMDAFLRAKGKYVWFLGDDDQLVPDHFAALLGSLSECESPMVFLPCEGIPECDRASLFLVKEHESFRLNMFTRQGRALELGECLMASGFLAFTVFRKDVLKQYLDTWKEYSSTWYGRWRITLLLANQEGSWWAGNRIMSRGNFWENLQATTDYQKTRSYRMQIVTLNRIQIWKELSHTGVGKLLRPRVLQDLFECYFRRRICAGEFIETLAEGVRLVRLLPLQFVRQLVSTPFAWRFFRGWISVYVLKGIRGSLNLEGVKNMSLIKTVKALMKRRRTVAREVRALRAVPRLACNADILRAITPDKLANYFNSSSLEREWTLTAERLSGICQVEDGPTGGVNPGDRRALWYLVRGLDVRSVLEIGTHVGASTVHIAAALLKNAEKPDTARPKLVTVDIQDVNDSSNGYWKRYGLSASPVQMLGSMGCADFTTFVSEPSVNYLDRCKDKFDLIFLDGDHAAATVYREIAGALKLLQKDGIVLLHDFFPKKRPLWSNGFVEFGPWLGVSRLQKDDTRFKVVPLGNLPWPTKLNSHTTSLALLTRE